MVENLAVQTFVTDNIVLLLLFIYLFISSYPAILTKLIYSIIIQRLVSILENPIQYEYL